MKGATLVLMEEQKLLAKALANPKDMRFSEMLELAKAFGFSLSRVKGGHHIFAHPGVRELVNIQNVSVRAKPYQVRQFLRLVESYDLKLGDD